MQRGIVLFIYTLLIFSYNSILVEAEGLGFNIQPVPHSNQLEDVPYFKFEVIPGKNEIIQVDVTNLSPDYQQVDIIPVDSSTNMNGGIQYTWNPKYPPKNLTKQSISSCISPQSIYLEGYETKRVDIPLNVPDTSFKGHLLGGLIFQKKTDSEMDKDSSYGMINNKFSLSIAIQIYENGDNEPVNFVLDNLEYEQSLDLIETLSQLSDVVILDANIRTNLRKTTSTDILITKYYTNVSIAPNSTFDILVAEDNEISQLDSGRYIVETEITIMDEIYKFSRVFSKEEKNIPKKVILYEDDDYPIKRIIYISILIIVFLCMVWFFLKFLQFL